MRILQVLPHFSKGGAEKVVIELTNSLIATGHQVTVLLAHPVDPSLNQNQLVNDAQVRFVVSRGNDFYSHYLILPFWTARNWKVLKTYDVIHCHLTYGLIFGFLISILRKLDRIKSLKLIATCHVVGVGVAAFPKILNQRLSYFFDFFVLMAQDAQWRKFIRDNNRENILLIANGISTNVAGSKSRPSPKNGSWKIGTISRLQSERKPWLFLETFANIQSLNSEPIEFILGGDGPERESLLLQSEKLGLKTSLSMPGMVQTPHDFIDSLDLYITLNVEAITGIAGLEAVYAGVPVVGIQLSKNYKNGSEDWIWSSQDSMAVAQKILEWLKDPTLLATVARKQHKVASETFSVERMRDKYLSLYSTKKQ
jgi:glycosyltransferase involved in cell wall biosynthesis